jgi:dihydrofolate reductase
MSNSAMSNSAMSRKAGLVDELRTHIAPVTLAAGERLFDGVPPLDLEILSARGAALVTHVSYRVRH